MTAVSSDTYGRLEKASAKSRCGFLLYNKTVKYVFTLLALLSFAGLAHAALYNTSAYVQEGLIAHWDACENAGLRSMNENRTTWADITGNHADIEFPNDRMLVKDVNGIWCYSLAPNQSGANGCRLTDCADIAAAITNRACTIELVCDIGSQENDVNVLSILGEDNSKRFLWVRQQPNYCLGVAEYLARQWCGNLLNLDKGAENLNKVRSYTMLCGQNGCAFYRNGASMNKQQPVATGGNVIQNANPLNAVLTIGRHGSGSTGPDMKVYALRIYDRVLTDEEILANQAVDVQRFVDGNISPASGKLIVTGEPQPFAAAGSPSYGDTYGHTAGENVALTAPSAVTNGNVIANCTGWTRYEFDSENAEWVSAATSTPANKLDASFTFGTDAAMVEWQWAIEYKVTAVAAAGGSVSKSEEWVAANDTFTATATPAAGHSFYRWRDAGGNTVSLDEVISLKIAEPVALTAEFGGVVYVDPVNGSDENGDGSPANPYKGIEFAYTKATDGSTLLLLDGTHNVTNRQLTISRPMTVKSVNGPANCTVKGAWAGTNASNTRGGGVFHITHNDVRLEGLTITGGNRYNYWPGAGAIYMTGGIVTNCVVRDNVGGSDGSGNAGAIRIEGGLVTDCVVRGNKATYNNNSIGIGGGIWMSGGVVENCVITNNCSGNKGPGVYVSGTGILRNSLVAENHGIGSMTTMCQAGGGVNISGGLVDRCIIRDCYSTSGGGVYLNGGKILNSLVYRNHGTNAGGGIRNEGGTVVNCTVADNTVSSTLTGTGFYQSSGSTKNTIIYGNPCGAEGDTTISGGTFDHNFTLLALANYPDNQHGNVFYKNAAINDYTLLAGSKAIDGAVAYEGVEKDLAGTARPLGSAPDMGCYEYLSGQGPLSCSFNAPEVTRFFNEGEGTFTASADGSDLAGLSYTWYFDGVQQAETGSSITWSNIGLGSHTVKVVASNSNGESAECEQSGVIKVTTDHVFANVNGTDEYPYDTAAKGAHKLQDALDAVWVPANGTATVSVKPGKYCPYSKWFVLNKAIRLESTDGPEVTHLYGYDPNSGTYDNQRIRRILYVNHPDAYVSGFVISNGWWYSSAGDSGPGGLRIAQGVVTNCVITRNRGGDAGGGVQMSGGLLSHCEIFDNYARYNNDGCNTRGGGVYMSGGTVEFCRIYRNWAANNGDTGSGVWMNGGTLRDCEIFGNFTKSTGMKGIGLCITGGLAERCAITNNGYGVAMKYPSGNSVIPNDCGGVYVTGGTLRNCLVAENKANNNGAGIYQTGGTVEYCTITANTSVNKVNSGLYLNGSKAVNRYNVIWDNGAGTATESKCNISYTAASSFTKNIVTPATSGTDNIDSAPGFNDAANRDWTLATGSPAIDAGPADDGVTVDLLGNERPKDGDGDDVAANDLGCYEAPDAASSPLSCSFGPESTIALDEATVTFEATVLGQGSDGVLTYTWDFGDGEVLSGAGTATPTVKFSTFGSMTVRLTVEAASGGTASKEITDCVRIGTSRVFVNAANENPVWPYGSWANAATNLEEALGSMVLSGSTKAIVTVSNGTYKVKEKTILLSYPIDLVSVEGPEKTFIQAVGITTDNRRCLDVTHADVFVAGFTLKDARWDPWLYDDGGAAALRLSAGVVSNCVVTGAYGARSSYGAVSVSGTGLLTHSVIRNSYCDSSSSSGASQHGGGLAISGNGIVEHCVISNCWSGSISFDCSGGGVYQMGGTLRDSQILDCYVSGKSYHGSAIWQSGGLCERCVIGDTKHATYGAAVQLTGGTMRNSLIFGAKGDTSAIQALTMSDGSFVNNTVVTNGIGTAAASPVVAKITGGSIANCIFASNISDAVTVEGGTIAHSRYSFEGNAANGNINADPLFRKPLNGDWSLLPNSPCVNKGDFTALGEKSAVRASIDLAGGRRFVRGNVDMGCYENQSAGTALMVR